MTRSAPAVWTIGHSNHRLEDLLGLLAAQRIELVADVRSRPGSRRFPQFGRERLRAALAGAGIEYELRGAALGGRPSRPDQLDADGHARYDAMAREPAFEAAIDELVDAAGRRRTALLCSEGDPHGCHRRLLVGKVLAERGAELRHIGRDGSVTVERSVKIGAPTLLDGDEPRWRSVRPVPGAG